MPLSSGRVGFDSSEKMYRAADYKRGVFTSAFVVIKDPGGGPVYSEVPDFNAKRQFIWVFAAG
jgi:hypothetical protein